MKKILALLVLLLPLAARAADPGPVVGLRVYTNGAIVAPTNFVAANSIAKTNGQPVIAAGVLSGSLHSTGTNESFSSMGFSDERYFDLRDKRTPFWITRRLDEDAVDTVYLLSPNGGWWTASLIQTNSGLPTLSGFSVGVPALTRSHTNASLSGTGWATISNGNCWGESYTRSTVSNDSISLTVTGAVILLRTTLQANGGYGLVTIDGIATNANLCPTVSQAQTNSGTFSTAHLGNRYVEFYWPVSKNDTWIPIADNLADAEHTITITATGTNRIGATGGRVYIVGFATRSRNTVFGQTDVSFATLRRLTSGAQSAILPVYSIGSGYLGEWHGGETLTSYALTADGASASGLTNGQWMAATNVVLERWSSSSNAHRFLSIDLVNGGVNCLTGLHWTTNQGIGPLYAAMLPVYEPTCYESGTSAGFTNGFTIAIFGGSEFYPTYDGGFRGYLPALYGAFRSSEMPWWIAVRTTADSVSSFSESTNRCFVEFRSAGWSKLYFNRVGSTGINPSIPLFFSADYRMGR